MAELPIPDEHGALMTAGFPWRRIDYGHWEQYEMRVGFQISVVVQQRRGEWRCFFGDNEHEAARGLTVKDCIGLAEIEFRRRLRQRTTRVLEDLADLVYAQRGLPDTAVAT